MSRVSAAEECRQREVTMCFGGTMKRKKRQRRKLVVKKVKKAKKVTKAKAKKVVKKPVKLAQASRHEHKWCRQCDGSGKVHDGVCKLCKGSGKVRFTLCLRCDQKMVMDHIYDKVCPNCKCRPCDVKEPYRVNFG
jgi:hypothetical protein